MKVFLYTFRYYLFSTFIFKIQQNNKIIFYNCRWEMQICQAQTAFYRYTTRYGKRINGLRVFANNTRTLIQVYSSSSSMYIITVYYLKLLCQQFALSFFTLFDFRFSRFSASNIPFFTQQGIEIGIRVRGFYLT